MSFMEGGEDITSRGIAKLAGRMLRKGRTKVERRIAASALSDRRPARRRAGTRKLRRKDGRRCGARR